MNEVGWLEPGVFKQLGLRSISSLFGCRTELPPVTTVTHLRSLTIDVVDALEALQVSEREVGVSLVPMPMLARQLVRMPNPLLRC